MNDDEISRLVFVSEDPVPADLAIVFAAADELDLQRRTKRGVDLYHAGYVPKLLLTGGSVLARECPEAERMEQIARGLGVPDADLLIEDRSGNTFENAEFSASVLQAARLLDKLATVILVSSEWHMRRVLLTTQAYFPKSIRFLCCPTLDGCNRDNWTQSGPFRRQVRNEAILLATLLEIGSLGDSP